MAQIYEYQDIDAHVILLFVHPAKTFQPKEREEEIVCPFLCISMILVQPRLYLYHIRTQDGAVYFVHSFVPEVISRLPE